MSDQNEQESVTTTEPNGEVESKKEVDVESLVQRLEQLESTNKRILDESKQYKEKYRSLRTEVEGKEQKQLEDNENWKELLDMEKNKTHGLNEQLQQFKKTALKKELEAQVARKAPDAFDVDDVIRSLPKDAISIDEEALTIKGIDEAISTVRESKHYLFKQDKTSGQTAARPAGQLDKKELSREEKDKEFRDTLKDFITN